MNAPVRVAVDATELTAALATFPRDRELGRNAVKDYTEQKTLHVHLGPRTYWRLPRRG